MDGLAPAEYEKLDDEAFAMFAEMYPHQAYDAYPERFLAFARGRCPHRSREEILRLLEETREE